MHHRFCPLLSQHPFDVSGGAGAPQPAGLVAYLQHCKFDRCIQRHINAQFGVNTILVMGNHGVAEAVPANVISRSAAGPGSRGPEASTFFVTEIKSFAAGIAYGIIGPWRE